MLKKTALFLRDGFPNDRYKYNLREHIPEEERGDMIAAYYKRLTSSDQVFHQLIFTKDHYNDLVSLQLSLQKIIL